jgi:hypothetical protein
MGCDADGLGCGVLVGRSRQFGLSVSVLAVEASDKIGGGHHVVDRADSLTGAPDVAPGSCVVGTPGLGRASASDPKSIDDFSDCIRAAESKPAAWMLSRR